MIPPTLTIQRLLIEPLALKHWESYAAAWADQTLTDPEIRCIIDIENRASMRVGEKLGFELTETCEGTAGPLGLFSRKGRG
jgi:hypothetical protein